VLCGAPFKPKVANEGDEVLKRLIDEEYTRHPFYGARRMVVHLGRCGHRVNRKRAQRLMRSMGLVCMAPGPNTSWAHPQHKVYASMGELLIGLTKYFAFYNGQRPHQALGNQTPDAVHASHFGGGALIVDKYGPKPGLPIALRCTGTDCEEVRIENESTIQNAKIGAAPSSCVKSGAA
jgi:HTH-like domain/Integrase core domain